MKKLLWLLLLAINSMVLNAQNIYINGKVSDSDQKPLENATIYLLKEKDSSIINYTATNKEGKFSLKTDARTEPSILMINAEKLSPYSKKIAKISESLSLGAIELVKNKVQSIEEIKITVSPVKIKKDTVEFNASAIKVRPDSKIEELLKQIPGVEIDNDKKITVNGKEVDQIMINGKPFFDKDGKIALQNLPADIIKNIQFTTTKTKEEELSGKKPKSTNTTINFNIDEKKNQGLLSRLMLGYGSDKRYEGSALVSYFKKDTKISLIASSNNINSQGFSNDDVFDSMGEGRNSSGIQSGVSSSGRGKGIQKSTTIGINYNDKFGKEMDLDNLSLNHSNSDTETASKSSRTTLLPDYTLTTHSESKGESESQQYNVDASAKIQLDSLSTVYISPRFSNTQNSSIRRSKSSTLRDNGLLNENDSYTSTESVNNSFNPYIYYSKQFRKDRRSLNAKMTSTISQSNNNDLNRSQTLFYQGNEQNDNRNQLSRTINQNSIYNFSAGYTEPISDSASVSFEVAYNSKISRDSRDVNDFNAASGEYSDYNSPLSNSLRQKISQISPQLSFEMNKKKFSLWGSMTVDISDMKVSSVYNSQQYGLQKNFALPSYNFNFRYQFSENAMLNLYNYSDFTIPGAEQLTPYEDTSNPLVTSTGNPSLKNTWSNNSSLFFNNYNLVKNVNYYVSLSFVYRNNDVVNYSRYDNSGKQLVTYDNVSGNKNMTAGAGFNKTFKWKDSKLTIGPRFNMQYTYNKGFINGQFFTNASYSLNPGLNVTYEIKDKFSIKPSYRLAYNFSKYTNYSIDKVNTASQTLKLELTNYLFSSRLVFGNDFEYNTNSNIAPGFKKDFYFWNTSLGYSFLKKQFTAKVKVYDVLNQNQSVRRIISNSYIEDREDLILKRYIMFSLSMKLNRFAGKKM
ncbi:outer membrane beta-barrel protein [Chryseobacterium vrystaatense]|uniref:CarboxypepD_reg-like domain-containing protein n=1 Tax=Chryseobacterium vrystaatense TaxID=307480 RepID=A0A1M5MZX5_9FLAO|nr:outer membrane beta-barrel protein [Chryseobacterium vrystaatense]SHG82864.1 CarboxypepD_reg-like domain-containing protein [Chryseobacterium vrystaatense]